MKRLIKNLELLLQINSIKGTGSQKVIQTLLQDNWNEDLEFILNVALNQFKLTHINKMSDIKAKAKHTDFAYFKELMLECISVKAMNNTLRDKVTSFVNAFENEDIKQMLTMVVTKNLNIGLGRKLINKAMKKTIIPTPSVQLASKGVEKIEKWDCSTFRVNIKYDGVRIIATYTYQDDWRFFTRNFNELDKTKLSNVLSNLNEIFIDKINNVNKYKTEGFFVDGELIAKDSIVEGENSSQARQSITGNVNRILKGKANNDIDKTFNYVLFDIDDISTLIKGKGNRSYEERRLLLESYLIGLYSNISLAKEYIIDNTEEGKLQIKDIYNNLIKQGEEGVIIKYPYANYECKRSKYWVKMKEVLSADLQIIDFIEGTGKLENTLGAILVSFNSGETVKVGSGFADEQRQEIWNNKEKYINKIVEIEYNAKSTDKKGNKSLFLPIFKNIRVDKDISEKY